MKQIKEQERLMNMDSEISSPNSHNENTPLYSDKSNMRREGNEIIKVFNYDGLDDKQMAITTPREELLDTLENQRRMNQIGDKTISKHTFEENDFINGELLNSSIGSMYFSKESKSNDK